MVQLKRMIIEESDRFVLLPENPDRLFELIGGGGDMLLGISVDLQDSFAPLDELGK